MIKLSHFARSGNNFLVTPGVQDFYFTPPCEKQEPGTGSSYGPRVPGHLQTYIILGLRSFNEDVRRPFTELF